jgi:gas vesicle protein
MKTNGESKMSFLLMGLGLTAIGGLVAALLARKETRDMLRDSAEGIVAKGKQLVSHCCGSADDAREAHEHDPKEQRRETFGA